MSVTIQNGVGIGSNSIIFTDKLSFMDDGYGSTAPATAKPKDETNLGPWSPWGTNNLLPYTFRDHIDNCGVLNAALDCKSRIAAGKGLQPFLLNGMDADGTEQLEYCNDTEILDWIEANKMVDLLLDFSYDKNSYGWRVGTFMLNGKRDKINRIYRKDVFEARLQKKTNGVIPNIYLHGEWKEVGGYSSDMLSLPLLKEGDELNNLYGRAKNDRSKSEFAFADRRRRDGRQYYPLPLWFSAQEWVKQARAIVVLKNALIDNGLHVPHIVTIHKKYWIDFVDAAWDSLPEAKKTPLMQATYDSIETWLTGGKNAGKSLFTGRFFDVGSEKEVPYVAVEPLDDKMKDGKLLPDSSAANSEILFALMVNPALMGAGQPGGPYSGSSGGSNVRESHLSQIMLLEEERAMNTGPMYVVKHFNGWAKRLETAGKRLVFRTPSGLLTTLDTGKSTKPEIL